MTIITDTSYLVAVSNSNDCNHQLAMDFAKATAPDLMLVPDIVLPELAYVIVRDLGHVGLRSLLQELMGSEAEFTPLEKTDLARMHEIATTYASAEFDIVDCCIMAIAERLDITRISTFDRRDFSIYRPRHCPFFELLPPVYLQLAGRGAKSFNPLQSQLPPSDCAARRQPLPSRPRR